ncbi:hypothetical protein HPULCUR_003856 [Helicostylum pulchrum]|uniref:Uncharacterized protein n=1 Tax=Helicostylum pulchrum TaxID=562976 RepID=A0ABP9XVN7_9FUNG
MPKAAKDGFRCAKLETPIPKSIAVRFDDDDKDYDSDDDLPESAHIYLANYKTKIELDHAILLSQFDTLDGDSYEEEGPSAKRPDFVLVMNSAYKKGGGGGGHKYHGN